MTWGRIPTPPTTSRTPYEIVWLCAWCAKKRTKNKPPHRCEPTLLPGEFRYCRDCVELHTCDAFRDYGKD